MSEDDIKNRAETSGKSHLAIDAITTMVDRIKVPTPDECHEKIIADGTNVLRDLYNDYTMSQSVIKYGKVTKNFATLYFYREYMSKVDGKQKLKRKNLIAAIHQQEGIVYKHDIMYS